MTRHSVSTGLRTIASNHGLLRSLTVREVEARYRGTVLGILWVVVYPLTMLAIYTYLFGVIFNARWPGLSDLPDFVLMLYTGLITYGIVSETLSRAPVAITSQPNYVKKVVFPLELLPLSHLGATLLTSAVGFGVLLFFVLAQKQSLSITTLAVPIVLAPMVAMVAGFAWLFAALGVFFRDMAQLISVGLTMLMLMSPIFYPVSAAPPAVQRFIYLNPLTYPIEEIRRALVLGAWPHWSMFLVYCGCAVFAALAGLWVFQKTRSAFADVV